MSEQINPCHKYGGDDNECPGCSHESHRQTSSDEVQKPTFTELQNRLVNIEERLFPEKKHVSPEDAEFLRKHNTPMTVPKNQPDEAALRAAAEKLARYHITKIGLKSEECLAMLVMDCVAFGKQSYDQGFRAGIEVAILNGLTIRSPLDDKPEAE